jgi:hypothetical protein
LRLAKNGSVDEAERPHPPHLLKNEPAAREELFGWRELVKTAVEIPILTGSAGEESRNRKDDCAAKPMQGSRYRIERA